MYAQDLPDRRRDAGMRQVTERDIMALTWIAEQYCICFDHLQRLLGISAKARTKNPHVLSASATQNAVSRWLELGYIDPPHKIIAEHPSYIWLSRRGITQLSLPYSYYHPRPTSVKHFSAVNKVRLSVQMRGQEVVWLSRRTLSRTTESHPLPDAELRALHTPVIAIQIIERPLTPMTLQDERQALSALLERYSSLLYMLHVDGLPTMHQTLATLPQEQQQRVMLSDLTKLEIPTTFQADSQQNEHPTGTTTA